VVDGDEFSHILVTGKRAVLRCFPVQYDNGSGQKWLCSGPVLTFSLFALNEPVPQATKKTTPQRALCPSPRS